ncbi:protein kinase [Bacillaceae bacterium Marseille-Q3522]|nr:protein kinase [Bacillaceae bacterium Marseille-Q3522]
MRFFKYFYRWLKDHPLKEGTILIDTYQIKEILGMGSYGIAYLSMDLSEKRLCVIKQLRQSRRGSKKEREQFASEIELMKKLHHPLVPRYLDDFTDDGNHYYVMSYVEGENLEELLFHEGKQFSEKEALLIIRDIAKIVDYLHEQEIFHCDLRIPNIVLGKDKHVYLIDFGLAIHNKFQQKKETLKTDDYFDLGDMLLYLLYSTYKPARKKALPWTEELVMQEATKDLLKRLLGIEKRFQNGVQVQNSIDMAIKQQG